jgi:hypothetical protein
MNVTNGHSPLSGKIKPARDRKPAKRKAASAARPAARGAAKRRANGGHAAAGYSETASRLMSRGKRAIGGAYDWAADGAGRALPRAARHLPDQRTLQSLFADRPLLLGAIGLGLGAMIGMILPGLLMSGHSSSASRRTGRSSRRQ